jgi:quercetin dioxygenase-like cupin family protein
MNSSHFTRAALLGLTLATGLALAAGVTTISKSATAQPAAMDHGLPHPTLLARGPFIDHVAAHIRVKPDGQRAHVMNVHDASEIVVLEILIEPGVTAPWHAHWGPGLLVNAGPGTLLTVSSHDCVVRELPPGSAVIDRGGDILHAARNESDEDVVIYVTFLGVPPGQSPVIPADPPADCDPF